LTLVSSFLPPSNFPSSSTLGRSCCQFIECRCSLNHLVEQTVPHPNQPAVKFQEYVLQEYVLQAVQLGRGYCADKDSTDHLNAESDSEEGDNINLYAALHMHCTLQPHLRLITSTHMLFTTMWSQLITQLSKWQPHRHPLNPIASRRSIADHGGYNRIY
jgi:hypothetical protein